MFLDNLKSKISKYLPVPETQTSWIMMASLFIMVTGNISLCQNLLKTYPLSLNNLPFLASLFVFFFVTLTIVIQILCIGKSAKWVLAVLLIVSSLNAYFMDSFGVVIDHTMMDNVAQTDQRELQGLITFELVARLIFLGLIPAFLVIKNFPKQMEFSQEFKIRIKAISSLALTAIMVVAPFTAGYASFIREHKIVRFYANPTFSIYSAYKYVNQEAKVFEARNVPLKTIATDAYRNTPNNNKRKLVIVVVGETARYDRFALNGYRRATTPNLEAANVVSFSNVSACGTSTMVSVPCMFSSLGQRGYNKETALKQENVIDVLARNGIDVLWRDNNSDSKGVALRVKYQNFQSTNLNPICDPECRDVGMLDGLDKHIQSKNGKDILIVLHQMGNHGPEYFRRYPKAFEKFSPVCKSKELKDCTKQEIDNAYDNAILYTDYFLSEVIKFLKPYEENYDVGMMYIADHGESLGEYGMYLHAAPVVIAPKEQTKIPLIVWTGNSSAFPESHLRQHKNLALSHDDVFCSLMVAYDFNSNMCKPYMEAARHLHNSLDHDAVTAVVDKGISS
ncbi:MAG: phosphoethanolamine transferase [Methylophilus sp.]|uniref:phosphoethanolamine transferase n=1 Tax=Methylophilus sp. TaxID=29541 RepID=UPI003F9FC523